MPSLAQADLFGADVFAQDDRALYPGLEPRFYAAASPLLRRDGSCTAGQHACLDVNSTGCCDNDRYCTVNRTTGATVCCAVGVNCETSCDDGQYPCNATSTITVYPTTTVLSSIVTLISDAPLSTSLSVYAACCPRPCAVSSMFVCPSSLGGNCCHFGQTCAVSGQCIWTASTSATASSTSTASGSTTILTCLATCTGSSTTSGSLPCCTSVIPASSRGLSDGAKAGIAVGVVVGAAALIGAGTWICIRKRRRGSTVGGRSDPRDLDSYQQSHSDLQPPGALARAWTGAAGADGATATHTQDGALDSQGSPASPWVAASPARGWRPQLWLRRNTSSQSPGSGSGGVDPPTTTDGLTQDYFGAAAVAGPYTDATTGHPHTVSGGTAGVPLQPQGPHDIRLPVEIDSRVLAVGNPGLGAPGTNDNSDKGDLEMQPLSPLGSHPVQHHELYGSDVPTKPATAASQAQEANANPEESPIVPRSP